MSNGAISGNALVRYLSSLHFPDVVWKIETLQGLPGAGHAAFFFVENLIVGVRSRIEAKTSVFATDGVWWMGAPTFACWRNRLICIMLLVLLGCRCDGRRDGGAGQNCTSRESETARIRLKRSKTARDRLGVWQVRIYFSQLFYVFFSLTIVIYSRARI